MPTRSWMRAARRRPATGSAGLPPRTPTATPTPLNGSRNWTRWSSTTWPTKKRPTDKRTAKARPARATRHPRAMRWAQDDPGLPRAVTEAEDARPPGSMGHPSTTCCAGKPVAGIADPRGGASRRALPAVPRCGALAGLLDRLADAVQVALAVAEPGGPLAAPGGRVVSGHLRDPVDGAQPGHVHFLEHHAAPAQLGDRRVDVVDLPGQLGVLPGRPARGLEDREGPAPCPIAKAARPRLRRLE